LGNQLDVWQVEVREKIPLTRQNRQNLDNTIFTAFEKLGMLQLNCNKHG
jgi:hypothetical protein